MSELDERIVDSVYKLELSRPKKSMMRDNMYNVDMKRCMKRFEKTIPGVYQEEIFKLIMDAVYRKKGIDEDSVSNDKFEDFLKSSMPKDYPEMEKEKEEFEKQIKEMADKYGVKIAHKKT